MKIASIIGICALASATALGCSGSNSTGGGFTGEDTSDDGGTTTSTGTTSGGSSSSGGSGSGASSGQASSGGTGSASGGTTVVTSDAGGVTTVTGADAAAGPDPETDYSLTKTVTMDPFPVPANSEVFYCQTFANPWGAQVDIKTYDLSMDTGSHHMFAFYQTNATNGSVAPCTAGGLTYGPFTFTSQAPKVAETYPATVGATLPASMGFNMMAHYLNTSTSPLTAHVSLTMYVAKTGVVTNHVGVIFDNNATMTVPATDQPYVSTSSLALNQDVYIISASSHMHKFGTNFIATATPPGSSTATTIYQTTDWDEPVAKTYSTPLHLVNGTTITWSCTDVNNTSSTLTFGEYAQTNVMCISVNIFYPVADVSNPVLGSAIGGL